MTKSFIIRIFSSSLWLAAGLSLSSFVFADVDDWLLDLDGNNSLGFRYGVGQDGLSIKGLSGELNLPLNYNIFFDYFRTSENQALYDLDYLNAGVSSNPLAIWSATLEYEFFGKNDVYEQNDYRFSVHYFPSHYSISIGLSTGNAEPFLELDLTTVDTTKQNSLLERVREANKRIDKEGYFADIKLILGNWQWGLYGEQNHYSKDFSIIGSSARIQQLFDQQALAQIYGLNDWRLSIDGSYVWKESSLQIGVSRIQSALDQQTRDYLIATTEYYPLDWLSFSFTLANSLQEHLPYGEIVSRFYW